MWRGYLIIYESDLFYFTIPVRGGVHDGLDLHTRVRIRFLYFILLGLEACVKISQAVIVMPFFLADTQEHGLVGISGVII